MFFKKKYTATPKGWCFYNYLLKKGTEKEDYIEDYEKQIEEAACQLNMSKLDLIKTYIRIFETYIINNNGLY